MADKSSKISGFYKLSIQKRRELLKEFTGKDLDLDQGLTLDQADKMIENVVALFPLPLGIATNFLINGKDYLIPMAIEEPSVVAAASNAARIARKKGGFHASTDNPIMIGQIQLTSVDDPPAAREKILQAKNEILQRANDQDPALLKLGGGAIDMEARVVDTKSEVIVVIHLLVNVKDAMGANAVNTMCEAVAPLIEDISGGEVSLRILSNLAVHRLARARATFDKDLLGGDGVVSKIIKAQEFAEADPYRCATHNKGIMNGIDALAIATGNDFRALEAGAHSYASLNGYHPLTQYKIDKKGDLVGRIELPIACGTVGGSTSSHLVAKLSRKILKVESSVELAQVMASLGLAQNLAALRALTSEGIQRGHMSLHARNLAISAGARGEEVDEVCRVMVEEGVVRVDRAEEILKRIRKKGG